MKKTKPVQLLKGTTYHPHKAAIEYLRCKIDLLQERYDTIISEYGDSEAFSDYQTGLQAIQSSISQLKNSIKFLEKNM